MSNMEDFVIEKGVLKEYKGPGGDVVIPEGVKKIGISAFCCCSGLTNVTIPEGVTEIGWGAFSGCNDLLSVTIPKGMTNIVDEAFYACRNLTGVIIPEGVKMIGMKAFYCCSSLIEIIIPKSVTTINEAAFQGCANLKCIHFCGGLPEFSNSGGRCGDVFDGCPKLRAPSEYIKIQHKVPEVFAKLCPNMDPEELAYLSLFQGAKAWRTALADVISEEAADNILKLMIKIAGEMPKLTNTIGMRIPTFALQYQNVIQEGTKKGLKQLLESKFKPGVAVLEENGMLDAPGNLEGACDAIEVHPENQIIQKLWTSDALLADIQTKVTKGIRYADGTGTSTTKIVALIIWTYARQIPNGPLGDYKTEFFTFHKDKDIEEAVSFLNRNDLASELYQYVFEKKMKAAIAALAVYGGTQEIAVLCSEMKKWTRPSTWRYIIIARGAMLLNPSRAVMIYMDKCGFLSRYAEIRNTDADTIRDMYLSDVGINEKGEKSYDLGNQTVVAKLQSDLSFLVVTEAGKTVKSLPKKDADPENYTAANDDFSEMKKAAKKIVKNRSAVLFEDFISGRTRKAEDWQRAYLNNPLLRSVAKLVLWQQGEKTFTLTDAGAVTANGSSYLIGEEEIAVAHPMEMEQNDVAMWQKYFTAHGLKQPFAQVWEPIIDPAEIKGGRYKDCMIPYYRFRSMDKHGIHVEDEDFHSDIDITFDGCETVIERIDGWGHVINNDDRFEVTSFSFKKYTRQINHIAAYLDRITIYDRILKDDITIETFLPGFTLAQITDFIKLATENNCPNVTALLLNYKNEHFADFDLMEEFTLGEL